MMRFTPGPHAVLKLSLEALARGAGLRARAKITSLFFAPMHPAWRRCESLTYLDMLALSRLARQAPQHLKM
jgi:hypothetical protein